MVRKIVFWIGISLVLGTGATIAGRTLNVELHSPTVTASFVPPLGLPDADYVEHRRADLTPPVPTNPNYSPRVRDVTTLRRIDLDGATMRRAGLYDGGSGDALRPVVILLHGANRDELSMIDMWDEVADAHGIVLLSLKSEAGSWDHRRNETDLIAAFLESAAETVPIDPSRVYLFGHSAGSIYAQRLANSANGPWRAVAGHAGTLPANWVQEPRITPPIRHYIGDADHLFPVAEARQTARAMRDAGHLSELVVIPGHTHWFYDGGPEIAADAWDWFANGPQPAATPLFQAAPTSD